MFCGAVQRCLPIYIGPISQSPRASKSGTQISIVSSACLVHRRLALISCQVRICATSQQEMSASLLSLQNGHVQRCAQEKIAGIHISPAIKQQLTTLHMTICSSQMQERFIPVVESSGILR